MVLVLAVAAIAQGKKLSPKSLLMEFRGPESQVFSKRRI
jgi:hypothetical protein